MELPNLIGFVAFEPGENKEIQGSLVCYTNSKMLKSKNNNLILSPEPSVYRLQDDAFRNVSQLADSQTLSAEVIKFIDTVVVVNGCKDTN